MRGLPGVTQQRKGLTLVINHWGPVLTALVPYSRNNGRATLCRRLLSGACAHAVEITADLRMTSLRSCEHFLPYVRRPGDCYQTTAAALAADVRHPLQPQKLAHVNI